MQMYRFVSKLTNSQLKYKHLQTIYNLKVKYIQMTCNLYINKKQTNIVLKNLYIYEVETVEKHLYR